MDGIPDISTAELADILGVSVEELETATPVDPDDLARSSFEAMVAKQTGTPRAARSAGTLHFTGNGVTGHTMSVDDFTCLIAGFQTLVGAVGGRLRGVTSARGALPADVRHHTRLLVEGSPLPGSVRVDLTPAVRGIDEAEPDGQPALTGAETRPLADESIARAFELLSITDGADMDGWADDVAQAGPRVARSLRRLFADIDRADICMDALWAEPGRPTERTSVSRADARRAITAIDNRSLTEEVRTLHGTIHTVSDRRPLGLMVDGQSVAVATDELASDVIRSMHVGQQVTIDVIERVESGPQGERVTYTATGLTVSDDDAESSMTNDDHEGQ
ncbi:hypothetical protein KJZ00_09755 [Cutibacterium avidum]|uniref:hypothetical protein n=1 Tax=Cutibacterium avidum TaxID=33010 RepID=UPI002094C58A|nr:hypothetical protein [Cutibacterium avidum]MCO6661018.1 hypothetical protein [Cutibacterium avidum]